MQIIIFEEQEDYLKRLGSTVRRLRLYHDMTMQQLADKCGYSSRATINKIEKGEINVPSDKIMMLADALETSPVELLGDSPEQVAFTDLFDRLNHLSDQDRQKALKLIDDVIRTFEE